MAGMQGPVFAQLQWSAGDFFGDPNRTIFDPANPGFLVPQGSAVYLIYDSDMDGSAGDLAPDGFSPDGTRDRAAADDAER